MNYRPRNCKMCKGGKMKMEDGGRTNFGKAFAEARKEGLKAFEWNGKMYTTELKEEAKQASPSTAKATVASQPPMTGLMGNADAMRIDNMLRGKPKATPPVKAPPSASVKKAEQLPAYNGNPRTTNPQYTATDATGTNIATVTRPNAVTPSNTSSRRTFTATDDEGNSRVSKTNRPAPKAKAKATAPPSPLTVSKPKGSYVPNYPSESVTLKSMQPDKTGLESGVVVDKGTNQAFIIKNGKIKKRFNVLTGENTEGETVSTYEEADKDVKNRTTPQGNYYMAPTTVYDKPGFAMNPLFGKKSGNMALHTTAHRDYRLQFYGTNKANKSYGCVNSEDCDIAELMREFPKGDTLKVINSKMRMPITVQRQMGGKMQGGGCFDPATGYPIPCQQSPKIELPTYPSISNADFMPVDEETSSPLQSVNPMISNRQIDDIDAQANQMYASGNRQYQQKYDRSLGKGVISSGSGSERRDYRKFYKNKYGEGMNPIDPFKVGMGLNAFTTGLSWLSGVIDRRRQDRYLRNNVAGLNSIESQPFQNFQPNPYNTYAKLGGNIKRHMYTNDAHNSAIDETSARMGKGGRWTSKNKK